MCLFVILGSLRGLDDKIVPFPNRLFPPILGFVVLTSLWNSYFNFKGKAKCRRGLGAIRWIALYVDTYVRMFHFMWWDNLNQTSGDPASHQSKQILRFSCEPNVFIAPDWESLHVFVFQHHTLITYLSDLKSDNGWKKLVDYCTSFNGLSLVSKSSFDTCCTCISHMQASYPVWDSVSVFIKIYELLFVIWSDYN